MNKVFRFVRDNKGTVATTLLLGAGAANAAGEYDAITAAVSFAAVVLAIPAIGALKALPKVVAVGTAMVLRAIGR